MQSVELLNQPKARKTVVKSEVLTNLGFLEEGQPWPPTSQKPRLNRYKLNKSKFDNELNINREAYDYILNVINDRFRVVSYRMLINLYRKVTYKTADLLFVERPTYITKDENQEELNEIVELSNLGLIGYEGAEDVSIYGDAIYTIKIPSLKPEGADPPAEPEQAKARMGITNPAYWFPVVEETDLKEIKHHILAHVVTRLEENKEKKEVEVNYLIYQIHDKGSYQIGERKIKDDWTLGEKTVVKKGSDIIETGLTGFAVIPTHGATTSDTIFGIDDYTDIINLIDELQIRMEKIASVIDKHGDPSLSGPASALVLDPKTGEYSLKLGGYLSRDTKEDPEVEYLTWDGKLEPAFKEIELILKLLSILTEMGPAMFDEDEGGGGDISGRALRLKYVRPLTKVKRYKNNFDDSFKVGLSLCSEVGYKVEIPSKEIGIEWKDGLPDDPKELAEIGDIRTGKKATDTVTAQIMKQDGLTREQADAKTLEIEAEMASTIPGLGLPGNFDPNRLLGDDGDDLDIREDGTAPQNIAATEGLNGAQIKAAVDVLKGVSDGTTAKTVAIELLIAVGIGKDKAEKMVEAQSKITIKAE